ncbi:hypothetical protein PT974_08474 [Cladobotryum mycophilum]|uniref:Uncharacterized protein n=1 Tax=Cladobotryum mycophilum TaxID=491253 RepID=A0ABR0SDG4_9HYPO
MSQSSSLAIPKNGASRFSKALPTVPGLPESIASINNILTPSSTPTTTTTITSSLSQKTHLPDPPLHPPPTKDLPKLPPLRNKQSIERKPVGSVPSFRSPPTLAIPSFNTPPSESNAPKMSISRKPVAKLQLPSPSPQHLYIQQPSPTDSFSSLLSAYTRDPDESEANTSHETTPASLRAFEEGTATSRENSLAYQKYYATTLPSNVTNGSGSGSGSRSNHPGPGLEPGTAAAASAVGAPQHQRQPSQGNLPPPTPIKNDDRQPSALHSKTEPSTGDPELTSPSSRAEIWKRRPHVSQNSRELPELKLEHSHGSTAETAPPQPPAKAPNYQAQSQASSSGRSKLPPASRAPLFAGGLPGRNIRPTPASDTAPVANQNMGNETSRLKHIKDKLSSSQRSGPESSTSTRNASSRPPVAQRPPTPEYQKEEVKEPVVDLFISPVSPASSPEAPRGVSPDFSKELPSKPGDNEAKDNTIAPKPIARKHLPTLPAQVPKHAKSLTQLQSRTNTSSRASGSPPSENASLAQTQLTSPQTDTASQSSHSSERVTIPSQKFGARPGGQRASESLRYQGSGQDPRRVQSENQGHLYRGRDGTMYSEMKVDKEPHPKAAYFPEQRYQGLPKDGVFKALPLTNTHFTCYQRHKVMNRRGNRNYPLTCQTCDKADTEDRWACAFCNLRICDSCFRKLGGHQRDLRRLVDELANSTHLSLPPQSRPGTTLDLHPVS